MARVSHKKILMQNALECLHIQRDIERLQALLHDLHEQTHDVAAKLAELESRKNLHHKFLSQSVLNFINKLDSKKRDSE